MKPIVNMLFDAIKKLVIDVDLTDEQKEQARALLMEGISSASEGFARGMSEELKEKL